MNLTLGAYTSMPANSNKTTFDSPSLMGIPRTTNIIKKRQPVSTILKRTTIPTLPMNIRKMTNNIKSKTIHEMVLEALSIFHIGISTPKKILQHTNSINRTRPLRLSSKFLKLKSDLGKTPKWSSKKIG